MAIDRGENPVRAQGAELLRRVISWALRWAFAWVWIAWPTHSHATEGPPGIADGGLHACVLLDLDRAIAVGERELVLRSEDGGKTWRSVTARGAFTYFAVGFDSPDSLSDGPRGGLIVGGRIDSITGRSEGVVELTSDDGRSWSRVAAAGLPRLLGMQRVGYRHWIAWGDWSDHWQSSFFETTDGGKTWSARPTPSGHLRCAAMDGAGKTIVIDRTGAVYFSVDGMEYQRAALEVDPFRPLRFCRVTDTGWWLGGDYGQLLFSANGSEWSRILLPGDDRDHALIQLRDAVVRGSRIWLVGEPGCVVWYSEDAGRHWAVCAARSLTGLAGIHALDDDVLVACGEYGRIQISRNGGKAWIDSHHSGERVACQAIAATEASTAWDALAYVTHESQRRAAALVIHRQDLQGVQGHRPEWEERLMEAGRQIGLDRSRVLMEFPVGDLRNGIRATDLGYYQSADPNQNELIRRLVLEIRTTRPDLIIAEDTQAKDSLQAAAAVATQQAMRLAASPTFRCFSPTSGIEIPEWNAQRLLLRGKESGGLAFAPTMLLNSSNVLLSEALSPVRFLESTANLELARNGHQATYRMSTQRTVTIKSPLDGMILGPETLLTDRKKYKRKVSSLMAAANASSKAAQLFSTRGSEVWTESAWDDALSEFAKELPNDVLLHLLWDMALSARRAGNWHRWNSALTMIIERDGQGSMSELAYRELMTHFGSPEVHRLIQDQWIAIEATKTNPSKSAKSSANSQSSPFATGNPVIQASYELSGRITPIARLRGLASFSRLLARWPESWQSHRTEPEWAWLIASRYRSKALLRETPSEEMKDNLYWPPKHPGNSGWSQILDQEQRLSSSPANPSSEFRIPWISSRPFLDGKDDENCWSESTVLELASPWLDGKSTTHLRIARDQEFLFLHSRSRKHSAIPGSESRSRTTPPPGNQRRRDALDSNKDHLRFRLDLDRDYATWFEFAWDIDGETLDQCNDMSWWNPEWYIAVAQDQESWSAEIAIPLVSLLPDPSQEPAALARSSVAPATTAENREDRDVEAIHWSQRPWAMAVVREIPSFPLQSVPMCESDRWSRDRWILALPQQLQSSPPERPAHLADPDSGFLDTKR